MFPAEPVTPEMVFAHSVGAALDWSTARLCYISHFLPQSLISYPDASTALPSLKHRLADKHILVGTVAVDKFISTLYVKPFISCDRMLQFVIA